MRRAWFACVMSMVSTGACTVEIPSPVDTSPEGGERNDQGDAQPPAPQTDLRKLGQISIANRTSSGGDLVDIQASFRQFGAGAVGCKRTELGACFVVMCPASSGMTRASAGAVRVKLGVTEVALVRANDLFYSSGNVLLPDAIPAGTACSASAAGELVPGFSIGPVSMPPRPSAIAPSDGATHDRTADLTVTWKPGVGDVWVTLSQYPAPQPGGAMNALRCRAPAGGGNVEVPASMLAFLVAGETSLDVEGFSQQTVRAGEFEIALEATSGDRSRTLTLR